MRKETRGEWWIREETIDNRIMMVDKRTHKWWLIEETREEWWIREQTREEWWIREQTNGG